mmetsp:Transcript_12814/g.25141  ORF Transcript_12814/g.25141 Transcript_12814/m.25141 type:complete len:117 (+) Transcript_12814:125-475(+)
MKFRTLECRSVSEDSLLPNSSCLGAKPALSEACSCEAELCRGNQAPCPAVEAGENDAPAFVRVGCFRSPSTRSGVDSLDTFDRTCQHCSSNESCARGLPFYASAEHGHKTEACYEF